MVFPLAPPSGKPSSLGETFNQDTHTGMAYLYISVPGYTSIKTYFYLHVFDLKGQGGGGGVFLLGFKRILKNLVDTDFPF